MQPFVLVIGPQISDLTSLSLIYVLSMQTDAVSIVENVAETGHFLQTR